MSSSGRHGTRKRPARGELAALASDRREKRGDLARGFGGSLRARRLLPRLLRLLLRLLRRLRLRSLLLLLLRLLAAMVFQLLLVKGLLRELGRHRSEAAALRAPLAASAVAALALSGHRALRSRAARRVVPIVRPALPVVARVTLP